MGNAFSQNSLVRPCRAQGDTGSALIVDAFSARRYYEQPAVFCTCFLPHLHTTILTGWLIHAVSYIDFSQMALQFLPVNQSGEFLKYLMVSSHMLAVKWKMKPEDRRMQYVVLGERIYSGRQGRYFEEYIIIFFSA